MNHCHGSLHRDLIEVVTGGVPFFSDQCVVVAMPDYPTVGPRPREPLKPFEQLRHASDITDGRTVEISRENGLTRAGKMSVGVHKPWHQRASAQIDDQGLFVRRLKQCF